MAGSKKEPDVTCNCPLCGGRKINQVDWLKHQGITTSGMARPAERMFYLGHWYRLEDEQ